MTNQHTKRPQLATTTGIHTSVGHWLLVTLFLALLLVTSRSSSVRAQPIPDNLTPYLLPGERAFTLHISLQYQGRLYQIHYFTDGDFSRTDPDIIGMTAPEGFEGRNITGLLVTSDGIVVEDEAEIREIFTLYRAAYWLYEQAIDGPIGFTDYYPFEKFRNDLRLVTRNPLFIAQILPGTFDTKKERNQEALRAILTPQQPSPAEVAEFADTLRQSLAAGEEIEQSVDLALETTQLANTKSIRTVAKDIKRTFDSWKPLTEQAGSHIELVGKRVELFNALDVLQLAVRLMWIADLQPDRTDWLEEYLVTFEGGSAELAVDARNAAITVISEAENSWLQRSNIVLDWVGDEVIEWEKNVGTQMLLKKWTEWSWKKYGTRVVGHKVASAASGILLTLTLADFLYGFDDLYSNFVVAETADDLRQTFWQGRQQLQELATNSNGSEYNGELAKQFQATYMLESLAAAQEMRSFGDGIEATVDRGVLSLFSLISWWDWANGNEWKEAAQGMKEVATNIEVDAENTVGHPEFLDVAVTLTMERLAVVTPVLGTCPITRSDGVTLHELEEANATVAYILCIDLTDPYLRFQTVMANDVLNVNPPIDQRESVVSMVSRAPYQERHPIAAFNADYFGSGHGAEGFTVVNGSRIDGSNSNDKDGNETGRVSQAFSRLNQVYLGFRSAEEVSNPLLHQSAYYNATGRGPTLVRDGRIIPDPCPPEGFSSDKECRQAAQTAVGLSPDGETLIVVVGEQDSNNVGYYNAEGMARLLVEYGANNGIKLDGGSSSQLWYRGETIKDNGGVANAVLVFREEIPRHNAWLAAQGPFPVVQPGASVTLSMTLRNTGFLDWDADLPYGLKLVGGENLGLASWQPVPATIPPYHDIQWMLPAVAPTQPGWYETEWQLIYQAEDGRQEAIGPPIGFVITVVPEGTTPDVISALQNLIDQAKEEAQGRLETFWRNLQQAIIDELEAALRQLIPPELQCLFGLSIVFSNVTWLFRIVRKRHHE